MKNSINLNLKINLNFKLLNIRNIKLLCFLLIILYKFILIQ